MMLDVKNLQIADVMLNWVSRNIRGGRKAETTARQAVPESKTARAR
jgi:hypothetical protein